MPELPEVETIRRQLARSVIGAELVGGAAHPSAKFSQATAAIGSSIEAVRRRGKYLLLSLQDGRELVIHLGMTGAVELHDGLGFGPDPYTRAWWALQDGRVLAFHDVRRFGRIAVVAAGSYGTLPTLARLGPEPFDPAFAPAQFYLSLAVSRAMVKTQLLSQRPVAGVGNIYADEALWHARVHPACRRVSRPRASRLHQAIVDVLTRGIDAGGTTLRDYRGVDGSRGGNQHQLRCYGREGQPCLRCGATLQRRTCDGRSTTFCPHCQRA